MVNPAGCICRYNHKSDPMCPYVPPSSKQKMVLLEAVSALEEDNRPYLAGAVRDIANALPDETGAEWRPIETFDFEKGFAESRWVLVHTSDGRVTEGQPFIMDGNKRLWICARGSNAHDPRYVPSPSCLRDNVTHWMPQPLPPGSAVKTGAEPGGCYRCGEDHS